METKNEPYLGIINFHGLQPTEDGKFKVMGNIEGGHLPPIYLSSNDDLLAKEIISELEREILDWYYDTKNNYGLIWYLCGYNGKEQQRVTEIYESMGVYF